MIWKKKGEETKAFTIFFSGKSHSTDKTSKNKRSRIQRREIFRVSAFTVRQFARICIQENLAVGCASLVKSL